MAALRLGQTKNELLLGEQRPSDSVNGCLISEIGDNTLIVEHRGPLGAVYTTVVMRSDDQAVISHGKKLGFFGGRAVPGIPPKRHVRALKALGFSSFVTPSGKALPAK
jgi:hypothetical protein